MRTSSSAASLLLPALLLAGLAAAAAVAAGGLAWPALPRWNVDLGPPITRIAPRPYGYREPGDFYRAGVEVDGPLTEIVSQPLDIMTHQVRAADYQLCVDDGACEPAAPRRLGTGDVPVTGVSFDDAAAYAAWLSGRTGTTWRLPTIAEWVLAAGERAVDPALGLDPTGDPAERWLALYEREAALGAVFAAPEPIGTFGVNSLGVADIAGSVWEWTASCASRTIIDSDGSIVSILPSCGVRYVEGQHRAQISAFVRDARAGGCSSGTPPDNLGFRLVREPAWFDPLLAPWR